MKFDIQKANFWKRISAWMLDAVLILCVVVGIVSPLSWLLGIADHYQTIQDIEAFYSEKYGIDFGIYADEYNNLTDEEKQPYIDADKEFRENKEHFDAYGRAQYMMLNIALGSASISIMLTYIILELILPIFFKHGRTLGKKIFGLAVIRTNGVKMSGQAHFIRSIIGKCAIETMVPVYILIMMLFGQLGIAGIIVLVLFLGLQIFVLCYTKTRSSIHDLISDTVVVDMASQEIFETEEDLIAYKNKLHEEMAAKQDY